ncbi:uncharacterized protein PG998_006751 [Apiospora kogelbergensis]|uniref:uncharacterized protein n=1 Tax=Apiospora kogelbergensis TaxID=1337665 RepID=UPI0031318E3E
MSGTRRSARLQGLDSVQPPANASTSTKQTTKAPAKASAATSTTAPPKKKATTSRPAVKKPTKAASIIPAVSSSAVGPLLSLPPELLNMVLANIKGDRPSLSALARASKALYSTITPYLYARVSVHATYHAHIAKLIRALEPLLTVAQKRQLKTEGRYKGQQERYSTKVDQNLKPICTNYVRQLVVGNSDPGRKHKYIVDRYVEETFKNLDNLDVVETQVMTASIAKSLAACKKLQALAILGHGLEVCAGKDEDALKPLEKIKGLRHLCLHTLGWSHNSPKNVAAHALLRNSASTLRTLSLSTGYPGTMFLWEKLEAIPRLTELRSLEICSIDVGSDDKNLDAILTSIDFVRLHHLAIRRLYTGRDDRVHAARLFERLAVRFAEASQTKSNPNVRSLDMNMSEDSEARCRFLASFDTLTELTLFDHARYPEGGQNPGLSSALLEAILKHKTLRTLKLTHSGIASRERIPQVLTPQVRALINGLPELCELNIVVDDHDIVNVARELAAARNLTSLTFGWDGGNHASLEVAERLIRAHLDSKDIDQGKKGGDFVWEDHYNLKRFAGATVWEITSKPPRAARKTSKQSTPASSPAYVRGIAHDLAGVWLKPQPFRYTRDDLYGPSSEWVDLVEKDLV